jgi:hypothetical protein
MAIELPAHLPDPKVGMVSLGCPKALVDSDASSPGCAPMAMR